MNLKQTDCRHGRMLVPTEDTYIGRSLDLGGEYSEDEVRLFAQILQPGMAAFDVGANIGAFTVPLSKLVGRTGRVAAFEPQPELFSVLESNCQQNYVNNALLYNVAVGDTGRSVRLDPIDYETGGNFGGVGVTADDTGDVPMAALDELPLPEVNFLKIDVEGYELGVVRGAEKIIQRCRPVLYVENDRPSNSKTLIEDLFERGYRLYWHTPRISQVPNYAGNPEPPHWGVVSVNMLCVPREREQQPVGFVEVMTGDDTPCSQGVLNR